MKYIQFNIYKIWLHYNQVSSISFLLLITGKVQFALSSLDLYDIVRIKGDLIKPLDTLMKEPNYELHFLQKPQVWSKRFMSLQPRCCESNNMEIRTYL